MRFHDYHLMGYQILDKGETIIFDLLYDYPDCEKLKSRLMFGEVALHNFTYSDGAIITFITELSIQEILKRVGTSVVEWAHAYGVRHWRRDLISYEQFLTTENYKAWEIESAIGFNGFVIAKSLSEA